jgi:hypothetical protein
VSASEEQWNELEAILLLQRAGKLVEGLRLQGRGCCIATASDATLDWLQRMMLGIWLLIELPSKGMWKALARHTGR